MLLVVDPLVINVMDDWGNERHRMIHAISKGSFINNNFVKAEGDVILSRNPSRNHEAVFEAFSSQEHVSLAVSAARKAYGPWNSLSQSERNNALLKLKKAFEARELEMATAISTEMGKVLSESRAEAKSLGERI